MIDYPAGFDATRDKQRPICGVLAVALAADVSFDVAFAACKRNMMSFQKRMRGATYAPQRDEALRELAVKFDPNWRCNDIHTFSVMQFCEMHADDGKTYLLEIRGHILTLKGGRIIDQHINKPWREYHHPRVKLHRAVRIEGKGW